MKRDAQSASHKTGLPAMTGQQGVLLLGSGSTLGQYVSSGGVRTCDDVSTEDFTNLFCSGGASIDSCLHSGDVTFDDNVAHSASDLAHGACELHIGSFEHGVSAIDKACEAAGFEYSYCLYSHGIFWFGC